MDSSGASRVVSEFPGGVRSRVSSILYMVSHVYIPVIAAGIGGASMCG